MPKMQNIPPASLSSLSARISYLQSFISFTAADAAALHAAAPVLTPLIPTVVDTVYDKLLSFDITAASFLPRQTGYSGEAPTHLADLSQEHPQIRFRKDFLAGYVRKLVTMDYAAGGTWEYLDKVGLMHTGKAGFKHRSKKPALRVEYMHCAILLGFVEDIIVNTVISHPDLDIETKNAVVRAVNKILWIQNDLFARHYIPDAALSADQWSLDKTTVLTVAIPLIIVGALLAHIPGLLLL